MPLRRCGRAAWRCPGAAAAVLLLAACTVEVGPPPESDPPLGPQAAAEPAVPEQPTEPQAWSRGLDLDDTPAAIDRSGLAEGLVPAGPQAAYSDQPLTFKSALNADEPPSEAELALKRAQERAAAAGRPLPTQATAVPVAAVDSQPLPAAGAGETGKDEAVAAEPEPEPEPSQAWSARRSRLPPPPKFPPLPAKAEPQAAAAPVVQAAAAEATAGEATAGEATAGEATAAEATAAEATAAEAIAAEAFVAEAWDAPSGTILVQVSAVSDGAKVTQEWKRLQARYPEVLDPLRLVVDRARLGERSVFFRVQAGAFGSEAGAAAACDLLISQGQACFVVVR